MAKSEEKCVECEVAVLGGMVVNVCAYAKPAGIDCQELKNNFLSGKITIKDMVDTILPKVKDNKDAIMELTEIMKLANEE